MVESVKAMVVGSDGVRWWWGMVAVNVMVARLVVVAAVKGRGGKVVDYEDCGGSKRWQCQAW